MKMKFIPRRGQRLAARIGQWRPAAEQLRASNPDLYARVLEQCSWSEDKVGTSSRTSFSLPADAPADDPDALVGLFLAEAKRVGAIDSRFDERQIEAVCEKREADAAMLRNIRQNVEELSHRLAALGPNATEAEQQRVMEAHVGELATKAFGYNPLAPRRHSLLDELVLRPQERLLASRCLGAYWYVRDTDFELVDQLARGPATALRTGELVEDGPVFLDSRAGGLMRRELTHGLLCCATPPAELAPPQAAKAAELLRALSVPVDEFGVEFSTDPDEAVVQVATAFARIARVDGSSFSSLLLASSWRDSFLGSAAHILHPIFSIARVEPMELERRAREFEQRLDARQRDSFRRSLSNLFGASVE